MGRAEADLHSGSEATTEALRVEVVFCPAPDQLDMQVLELPPHATVQQALQASGVLQRHGLDPATVRVGVWGRVCALDTALRQRDRVELYRPLTVDPKEARRLRYKRHREAPDAATRPR